MKKQILTIATVLFVSGSLILTGCKKDDTTAPTISLKGDATQSIYVGETFTDAGATAEDDEDGDITSSIVKSGTVDNNQAGEYTIRYNATDEAGNAATEATRKVTVMHKNSTVSGAYNVSESCNVSGTGSYSSTVVNGSTLTDIVIGNFGGFSVNINGKLSGATNSTITIPSQVTGGATFSGSGTVSPNGKTLNVTYTVSDGTSTETCTKNMTR